VVSSGSSVIVAWRLPVAQGLRMDNDRLARRVLRGSRAAWLFGVFGEVSEQSAGEGRDDLVELGDARLGPLLGSLRRGAFHGAIECEQCV